MSANRRTNTKPELALRSALHSRGYRFRKDLRIEVPGVRVRPDIVFTRVRVAVFVDGCFWHACPEHGRPPTHNEWYWTPKLQRNVARDVKVTESLESAGWRVVRIWEHVAVQDAVGQVEAAVTERGGQSRLARLAASEGDTIRIPGKNRATEPGRGVRRQRPGRSVRRAE